MLLLFLATVLFAFSYNVGDTHIFYLPSHLMIALLAAPGIVLIGELAARAASSTTPRARHLATAAVSAAILVYATARVYRDYPALDRSEDTRPTELLNQLTADLDDQNAIFLTDLNWQVQNGLSYFAKIVRPGVAWARMPDVVLYAPALIRDNFAVGRDVVMTERARDDLHRAYGPLFSTFPDSAVRGTIRELAAGVTRGTPYVLCVLRPAREFPFDPIDVGEALRELASPASVTLPTGEYIVVAGLAGERPALAIGADRPFRERLTLGGIPVEIRMDAWLSHDTIRRMGFGHVIVARRHTLIVERGVSFAAFDADGRALRSGYAASLFASQPRYRVARAR